MSYDQDYKDYEQRREARLRREVHAQSCREGICYMGVMIVFLFLCLMAQ